jgi:hypothetical protein
MSVHVVADNLARISQLRAMLEQHYVVTSNLLGGETLAGSVSDAVVVTADLRGVENITVLKEMFGKLSHVRKRIFLIDQKARLFAVQAYALGATRVLVNPSQASLLAELRHLDHSKADPNVDARGSQEVATAGATAIASMFSAVLSGKPIDVGSAKGAGDKIADNIAEHGLSNWLETVRRHHEGTYQHCLLVTGTAVEAGYGSAVFSCGIS